MSEHVRGRADPDDSPAPLPGSPGSRPEEPRRPGRAADAPRRPGLLRRVAGRHPPPPRIDPPPESVALVLLSAIGDVVHAMPVVTSLREAWPGCELTWVVQPTGHALVGPHPDVTEFVLFPRRRGVRILGDFLEFRRRMSGRRFDLVVDLQVYLKAGLLTAMLDAPVKLGFDRVRARDLNGLFVTHRIPPRSPQHVQEQYFEFLEALGVPPVRAWKFAFTPGERAEQRAFFRELERPALAVVLKTTREAKDWLPERFARVLEAAHGELGLQPVIVGSEAPAEAAAAEVVRRSARAPVVDARRNDLRRLAWILDGSVVFLGPDTGPLHVAAALGTPTVGLYGGTDPRRVGPYPPAFRDLVVDRYSRPGEAGDRLPSAELRPGRMEEITVEDALEKLELAVERHVRGDVDTAGGRMPPRGAGGDRSRNPGGTRPRDPGREEE